MNESVCMILIRLWANQAWSDMLSKIEADALLDLIGRAAMLREEEKAVARGFLKKEPESALPALAQHCARLDRQLRRDIYEVAYYLTLLDGKPNKAESEHLARVQRALALPDELVQNLQASYV